MSTAYVMTFVPGHFCGLAPFAGLWQEVVVQLFLTGQQHSHPQLCQGVSRPLSLLFGSWQDFPGPFLPHSGVGLDVCVRIEVKSDGKLSPIEA